jgi:hypothetical protein
MIPHMEAESIQVKKRGKMLLWTVSRKSIESY